LEAIAAIAQKALTIATGATIKKKPAVLIASSICFTAYNKGACMNVIPHKRPRLNQQKSACLLLTW
jgi:hypothetical protein